MVLAWIVALIGLYFMLHWPRQVAVGIFILPLVLGLVVIASFAPRESNWLEEGIITFWGTVHGMFLLGGAVSTCLAFAAGLMYLAQMRRLKLKRSAPLGFMLPSLEQTERVNRVAITVAFPLLTFGLLIGLVLSVEVRGMVGEATIALSWTDPKVLSFGDVACFYRSFTCTLPAGDEGSECNGADNYCICLPGVYMGGN